MDIETGESEPALLDVNEHGARITDHTNGLVYYVVIEPEVGGWRLTHLAVDALAPNASVTRGSLSHGQLIRHARAVLAEDRPRLFDRRVSVAGSKPPLHQLAADYARLNRDALQDLYGVSRSTLSRWIQEARNETDPETGHPYLPPARRGRPPQNPRPPAAPRRRQTDRSTGT